MSRDDPKRPRRAPVFHGGIRDRVERARRMIADYVAIRRSGRFDPAHYLSQIDRPRLKHRWPLAHYLMTGERKGLEPAPGFAPLLYLGEHEHLIGLNASLFAHYLRSVERSPGFDRRAAEMEIAAGAARLAAFQPRHPIAIVCHVFYLHLVDELISVLRQLDFGYDLFVTVTVKEGAAAVIERLARLWPQALIIPVPNVGRDVLPFVNLAASGAFAQHVAICKIHSKKSVLRADGDRWRRALIDACLAGPAHVARMVDAIRSGTGVGLITADAQIMEGEEYWGPNRRRTAELCARIGIDVAAYPLRFASGSIFWLHPRVLERLNRLGLAIGDFEPEAGQIDGTTAHAVERVIGFIVQSLGLQMQEAGRY
jgi:lipopolysaccharide biosynthesis protein